jgi:hypothetical protein
MPTLPAKEVTPVDVNAFAAFLRAMFGERRASGSVPVAIFEASRFGICAAASVPAVIFEASRFGICAAASVPVVIFEASRLGIRSAASVPVTLAALRFVSAAPEPTKDDAATAVGEESSGGRAAGSRRVFPPSRDCVS